MFAFRKIRLSDAKLTMDWRVQPEINRYLLTDVEYDLEKQEAWLRRIVALPETMSWVIEYASQPIGVVNLADYNPDLKTTSWGWYIGELKYSRLGGFVPPCLYNYLFYERASDLEKIEGPVFSENINVIRMHEIHGYREVEMKKRQMVKNGVSHEIVWMELLRADWDARQHRYGNYVATFE
ncbi:MAG: GNAT family N-acetyltransferase [Myxococcota bacterium]|nr:GNAT family N-acetyltransferase [Myxococcota bacterium]